jgi:hypothetical protein
MSDEAAILIGYMPLAVRSSAVTEWERGFCASIIAKNNKGRFTPTAKQITTMRRIADKFREQYMRDDALTEDPK